jgi:hypothetical protein
MIYLLLQLERVLTMQLAQEIFTVLIVNTPTVTLLLFIFNIYKKKVEQTEKKVNEIEHNYLERFREQSELIIMRTDKVMEKLGELSTDVAVVQSNCFLIQEHKKNK